MDMRYTEEEKKKEFSQQKNLLEDTPEYPYGLRIELRPEDVKKLGLEDCDVGDVKDMMVSAVVIEKRQDPNFKGSEQTSVELQITDINVKGKTQDETIYE